MLKLCGSVWLCYEDHGGVPLLRRIAELDGTPAASGRRHSGHSAP